MSNIRYIVKTQTQPLKRETEIDMNLNMLLLTLV